MPGEVRLEQRAYERIGAPRRVGHPELNPHAMSSVLIPRPPLSASRSAGTASGRVGVDEHLGIGQGRLLVAEPQAGKGRHIAA
jgi:hypothetical protein